MKSLFLILLVAMTVSCATITDDKFEKWPSGEVLSWKITDFSKLNDKISKASSSHQDWVNNIQLYVFHLFDLSGLKKVVYESEFDNIENPTEATVTLVRDGFLDDSVRGDVHRISFHRTAGGAWKIVDLKKSQRCWRADLDEYSSDLCP